VGQSLEEGRQAYAQGRWEDAHRQLTAARAQAELAAEDLAALADAAWWLGHTDESLACSEELYRRCLQGEQSALAARVAVEVGFLWLLRGEETVGSGWVSRAVRLLEGVPECAEHGYVLYLRAEEQLSRGDHEAAAATGRTMQQLATRHDDPTLGAVGLVVEGTALVRRGRLDEGLAVLDEAMLGVRAGEVQPTWTGNLYCHLMSLFIELGDIPRARAWTDATERWCDEHSNPAMFVGICRVHRAQLLHLEGAWPAAERSAAQACRDLADMNVEVVAEGHYEIGELRRLQGDDGGAEEAYARAQQLGRDPQPGMALLRLAQGRTRAAATALRTALLVATEAPARAPLLAAQVAVADAAGDAELAAAAAGELATIADVYATPGLSAAARQASGVARLVGGEPERALPLLRDAWRRWRELDAPCYAARVRVLLARALMALDDADGAAAELDGAREALVELGAVGELWCLEGAGRPARVPEGLTGREVEVLVAVAGGATNRAIARDLSISERTVERHLSNIFTKLGVASRTEAAAYAFAHHLVDLGGR
jgi:ATP/maltotriose-dependent transcriptional regulator MalT